MLSHDTVIQQQRVCHWVQDGILSDEELNNFQIKCFSAPLGPEELAGVKNVVASKMPQVSDRHSALLDCI